MRYFFPLLLVLWVWGLAARAQSVAYGDWQLHLPANHPQTLADAGDRLYVADDASFYYLDKNLNSTQRLSRREGLSDVGVNTVAYDSANNQVIVAYQNGNLDLLRADGTVKNITDILRKAIQTAKTITQIQVYNGVAYLASNLGLIVLDLTKFEVRDTYSAIGPSGQAVTVYGTAVVHDTIFASTSQGVLRGRISAAVNLLDYRSWTKELPNPSAPADNFAQLLTYRGHVYAQATFRGLYYLAGTGVGRGWRYINGSYGGGANRLRPGPTGLLFSFLDADLRSFNATTGALSVVLPQASVGTNVKDMARQADGTTYVASYDRGLLRFSAGQTTNPEVIRPNAPETTAAYGLLADAATNSVTVFSGGYSGDNGLQFDRYGGFYQYQNGQWTNYTHTTLPSATDFPNLKDMSRGTRTADGTLYVASYGNGLLQWQGPGKFKQFTAGTPGSPLRSSLDPDQTNLNYVRVTDVATDPNGRYVWVINRHQRTNLSGLFRYRPGTDTWQAARYFAGSENTELVVVDNFGNPWATQSRKGGAGVAVYDTLSNQGVSFGSGTTNGAVYAIARDRTGSIWLGTGDGVSYYSDPSLVISALASGTSVSAFTVPYVRRGTGSGYAALYNTVVRCIAVDGANRKWFGTPTGLWLFSANADEALLHFTTANSPLPSNSIVDVAVNDKTGEVFVATDAGVVSYQGSASLTDSAPSCAEVFPNPVRPEFAGQLGIRGLVNNAYVKITDVAGHLVYSTRAAGGTLTWDLNDAQGRRVRSGMYLVLTSDADGKNSCVSKVAVLSR
ncbi:MAG: two-component regulator propeller domain-containing protein [Janthinobacterium lividum]